MGRKNLYTPSRNALHATVAVYSSGGFVAWPENNSLTAEEIEKIQRKRLYRQRKKFVAWPNNKTVGSSNNM